MARGVQRSHETLQLLDCPLWHLERSVQVPCPMPRCIRDQCPGLLDNPRVPCTLEVKYASGMTVKKSADLTARQVLQHNMEESNVDGPWWLVACCRECRMTARIVYPTDTEEKLHLDLRDLVTHDKSLPLLFDPEVHQPTLPADAAEACMLAQKFDATLLNEGLISAIRWSLEHGVLHKKLRQKMVEQPWTERRRVSLRVGIGLRPLGLVTAVMELWPVGHRSSKHHHGGCAGSMRVLHGLLGVRLYDSLFATSPIRWNDGDGGLRLAAMSQEVLFLRSGHTTWMNRSNWFVHEVECNADHPENRDGFAVSLHVYKSCVDEFELCGDRARHVIPSNDFFWNIDLPFDDARLQQQLPDFVSAVNEGIHEQGHQLLLQSGNKCSKATRDEHTGGPESFCSFDIPFACIFDETRVKTPRIRSVSGGGESVQGWIMDLPFDGIFDTSWHHSGGCAAREKANTPLATPSSIASADDSSEHVASVLMATCTEPAGTASTLAEDSSFESCALAGSPHATTESQATLGTKDSLDLSYTVFSPRSCDHDLDQSLPWRCPVGPSMRRPAPPMLPLFVEALGRKLHEMRHETEPSAKDLRELRQLVELCFPSY